MFSSNGKISEHQAIRLLTMDMFTGACLFLPMALPRISGYGGLLAYVIGILLTWGYGWLVAKNMEGVSIQQWLFYCNDAGARLCRGIYGLRCFACYVFLMGLFSTVLQETFLYAMPKWLIIGAIAVVLIYGCRKGLEVRARLAEIFFYIILVPILLIGLFSLPEARWGRLVTIEGATWQGVFKGALVTWVVMAPIEWFMYMKLENEKGNRTQMMHKTMALGAILAGIIYMLCLSVLNVPGMQADRWPTVILMQIMKIPGGFVSRQDGFMLSFWIFAMFMSLSGAVSHASRLFNVRNRSNDHRNTEKMWLSIFIIFGAVIALKTEMQRVFLDIYFYGMIGSGILSGIILLCRWFVKNKKRKCRWFLGGLLVLTLGLSGCESYVELENRDFVMAMGVDRGETKNYAFTFSFPDLSALTGNGTKGLVAPVTIEADSLEEAEMFYNQMSEHKLDYGQLKIILFGNTMLDQKKRLDGLMDEIKNNPKIARTVYVCRCMSQASDLISIEEKMETSVGIYLEQLFKNQNIEMILNKWMLERDINTLPIVEKMQDRLRILE